MTDATKFQTELLLLQASPRTENPNTTLGDSRTAVVEEEGEAGEVSNSKYAAVRRFSRTNTRGCVSTAQQEVHSNEFPGAQHIQGILSTTGDPENDESSMAQHEPVGDAPPRISFARLVDIQAEEERERELQELRTKVIQQELIIEERSGHFSEGTHDSEHDRSRQGRQTDNGNQQHFIGPVAIAEAVKIDGKNVRNRNAGIIVRTSVGACLVVSVLLIVVLAAIFAGSDIRQDATECLHTREDLFNAVDAYLVDSSNTTDVARKYGWPISVWCVEAVEDFSSIFSVLRNPAASAFNEDLSGWNTSRGTNMHNMFKEAVNFSQPLDTWDVSNVRTMRGMFKNAARFNGNISNWNVASLKDASEMFFFCQDIDQDLSSWDVGRVTDMTSMFRGSAAFNSDISKWNVSNVQTMEKTFDGASSFDSDLSMWDVSNVRTMERMFYGASSFSGRGGLSNWNVSRVISFRKMFELASSFADENLCTWVSVINNASTQNGGSIHNSTDNFVGMFFETACDYQDDPIIVFNDTTNSYVLDGNFCSQC